MKPFEIRSELARGLAIPAHPLALDARRRLDERRQRALTRYYLASGAGGLAVGVHTTQFAIREPRHGLYEPVLALAAEEAREAEEPVALVGGVCGSTPQALSEAALLRELGYHAALLSLAAWRDEEEGRVLEHCRAVGETIPLVGFYLQPSVGGRVFSAGFWRRFAEIEAVVAIKIAPFHRYRTLDVVRGVIESGREDVSLYTGNDDNIVADLVTPFRVGGGERRIVGGLLGQWSVWTRRAVEILERCRGAEASPELLALGVELTDANGALFDVANDFRGCIAGLHEILRRQGLLEGTWCLDEDEGLGPGQREEIERVLRTYPHLCDDDFVEAHRDEWLR